MKKKKLFLFVLAVIPLGIFAQEIRYVAVPASQEYGVPQVTYQQYQQYQQPQSQPTLQSEGLVRDTLKTSQKKATHTTFMKNEPADNWFLSVYGGAAMLWNEEAKFTDFGDKLNFTGGFAIGKWWSPIWGIRLSTSYAKLDSWAWNGRYNKDVAEEEQDYRFVGSWLSGQRYASAGNNYIRQGDQNSYTDGITDYGARLIAANYMNLNDVRTYGDLTGYTYNVTYAAASIDLMLNLKNAFTRYNPKAVFNPVLYGGLGWSHTFKADAVNPKLFQQLLDDATAEGCNAIVNPAYGKSGQTAVNSVMIKTGMQLGFRLSDALDFFIDGQWLILPEFFDRRVGDNMLHDWVLNAQIGFTYKFNERHFYEPLCNGSSTAAIVPVNRTACCDDLQARLNRIENLLQQPRPIGNSPYPIIPQNDENLKVIVYFVIDRHEVRQSEMYKLDEIAKFMAKHPRVRVSIAGYADVQTAYPEYNMRLSKRRADEVARILTTKYGIDSSRLRVGHYGDTVQPFNVNELNRAVIAFDIPE